MNLKERLQSKDWNVAQVARVAGFHVSTITAAARGISEPAPETVACILEALQRIEADPTLQARPKGRPKAEPRPPVPPQERLVEQMSRMVNRFKVDRYRGNNSQWAAIVRIIEQVEESAR